MIKTLSQIPILPSIIFLTIFLNNPSTKWIVRAQTIPTQIDGFVYGDVSGFNPNSVLIEAFFDPVCSDSRDSWPPLKQVLHYYGSNVSLTVHPFPLPYHANAFVTSRALHIVNGLNTSATYPLLESFFKIQEAFYNSKTINKSRSEIINSVVNIAANVAGHTHYSAIKSGFKDQTSNHKTITSFEYGCSRGVFSAPFFSVNGFLLPGGGSAIDYNRWRTIIDPLIDSVDRTV